MRVIVKVFSQYQDKHYLHELARLKMKATNGYPSDRAPDVASKHEDEQERNYTRPVKDVSKTLVVSIVYDSRQYRQKPTDDYPVDLRNIDIGKARLLTGLDVVTSSTIQVD